MNVIKFINLLAVVTISITSCQRYPKDVQEALELSGKNKNQLEDVIKHYSKHQSDSLKLEAAYFLIGNMPGKYYLDGDLLKYFYKCVERVEDKTVLDSITNIYGPFNINRLTLKLDVQEIKSQFLIANIDMAFKVWKEQPWGKDINFKQFCEYILPYRVGDEIPDYDRKEIYKKYNHVLDSVRATRGDAIQACYAVNNVLKKDHWLFSTNAGFLPYFSAHTLLTQNQGNCRDMVSKTIFIMRALGIPVTYDLTPNWGNHGGGHIWNVVLDKHGKNHTFMGTENNSTKEIGGGVHFNFPKVFRNTFGKQDYSADLVKNAKNGVPTFFKNEFIKDVTDENTGCSDVTISLNKDEASKYNNAYICVFEDVDWVAVDWGTISKNNVIFKKMMKDIVYLPAYFKDGIFIPANYPFFLTSAGKPNYLVPHNLNYDTVKLVRKYPIYIRSVFAGRMKGGKFQAANNVKFNNAVNLYTINIPQTDMKWYDVPVKLKQPYKYYRYLSPDSGWANVAEVAFYSKGRKVVGRVIGSPGSYNNNSTTTFLSAMDGDEATYFDFNKAGNGWVGLDVASKIKIESIRFLPRNDDNGIDIGQQYELVYWYNNQWVSLGKKYATQNLLIYPKAPLGALYLLHNLTKGKEERIFTYENGKQVWW